MAEGARQVSRRELLKTGAVVAGGAVLAPSAAWILTGRRQASAFPASVPASRAKRPNVIFIVLDTVRADHMSCYGYYRETTPQIDAFAAESRLYSNVLSPSFWTGPSHASFFTGLPTSAHGVHWLHVGLGPDLTLLPEQLRAAGYQTGGFSSNYFAVNAARGFDRGFETFWTADSPHAETREALRDRLAERLTSRRRDGDDATLATAMHRRLGRWFDEQYDPARPFFVFLNYIEPHLPYEPAAALLKWSSRGVREKWQREDQTGPLSEHTFTGLDVLSSSAIAELADLYDDEITYTDRKVGELLAFLRANGLDENTLIAITSDHGEHFGEHHLMAHQYGLYEPLVRMPLIVRLAGRFAPGRDEGLIQSHDLYPTILELAGVEWTPQAAHNCRSLLAPPPGERRAAFAEHLVPFVYRIATVNMRYPGIDASRFLVPLRAVQVGRTKLIRHSRGEAGEAELYDLDADPLELRDLAGERPDTVNALANRLDDWLGSFEQYEPRLPTMQDLRRLSPEELKSMRGLGYIN
jgi:arylsulfatase A-like enzyme